MHTATLKKLALALTFWLAVHMSALRAQVLGPYGTSPTTFGVDADGLLFSTGTYGTGSLSLSGAGTRMFWYPGKAAFRAGFVNGSQWDDANIGGSSVAFGGNTTASGYFSTASGYGTTAYGNYSTAFGLETTASGQYAVAFGEGTTASGSYTTAFGGGTTAYGNGSTAFGLGNTAYGNGSTAFGSGNTVSGSYSMVGGFYSNALGNNATALGGFVTASGNYSSALGYNTNAIGGFSTAFGSYTTASAYDSFVIGASNLGLSETGATPDSGTWIATDPLFEIGNGAPPNFLNSYAPIPSDAFVVYKNGDAALHGKLRVASGGDLSMGSFTAGTPP